MNSISAGTKLCSAELLLYEKNEIPGQTLYIHQVTTAWNEASATWNTPWTTPGGDYAGTTASFLPDVSGGLKAIDVTLLAQDWVNNSAGNFGLLMRSTTTGDNGVVQFDSLDAGTVNPPRLIIQY